MRWLSEIWRTQEDVRAPRDKGAMDVIHDQTVMCARGMFTPSRSNDGTLHGTADVPLRRDMGVEELLRSITPLAENACTTGLNGTVPPCAVLRNVKAKVAAGEAETHVYMWMCRALRATSDPSEILQQASKAACMLRGNPLFMSSRGETTCYQGWVRVLDTKTQPPQMVVFYLHHLIDPSDTARRFGSQSSLLMAVPTAEIGNLMHMKKWLPFRDPQLWVCAVAATMHCTPWGLLGGHLAKRHAAVSLLCRMHRAADTDLSSDRLDREAVPLCDCALGRCRCSGAPALPPVSTEHLTEDQHVQLEALRAVMRKEYSRVFLRMMPFRFPLDKTSPSCSYDYTCSGSMSVAFSYQERDTDQAHSVGFLSCPPRFGKTRIFLLWALEQMRENPRAVTVVGVVQADAIALWHQEASKLGMADRVVPDARNVEALEPGKLYVVRHATLSNFIHMFNDMLSLSVILGLDESHLTPVRICELVGGSSRIARSDGQVFRIVCISATPLGKSMSANVMTRFSETSALCHRVFSLAGIDLTGFYNVNEHLCAVITFIQSHATALSTEYEDACWLPTWSLPSVMTKLVHELPWHSKDACYTSAEQAITFDDRHFVSSVKRLCDAVDCGQIVTPRPPPVKLSDIVDSMQARTFGIAPQDEQVLAQIESVIGELEHVKGTLHSKLLWHDSHIERLIDRVRTQAFYAASSTQLQRALTHAKTKLQWYKELNEAGPPPKRAKGMQLSAIIRSDAPMPERVLRMVETERSPVFSEQDWLCPVCGDETADVITECGHGYCKGCLQQWISMQNKARCPTCRGLFAVAFPVAYKGPEKRVVVSHGQAKTEAAGAGVTIAAPPDLEAPNTYGAQIVDAVCRHLREAPECIEQRIVMFVRASLIPLLRAGLEREGPAIKATDSLRAFTEGRCNVFCCSYHMSTAVTLDAGNIWICTPAPDASAFRQALSRTYMVAHRQDHRARVPRAVVFGPAGMDRWWDAFAARAGVTCLPTDPKQFVLPSALKRSAAAGAGEQQPEPKRSRE